MRYRFLILVMLLADCGRTGFDGQNLVDPPPEPPPTPSITLTGPSSALPFTKVRFSADVRAVSTPTVTWSITGPSTETIAADGVLAVPPTAGTFVITAVSDADPTLVASINLAVTTSLIPTSIATPGTVDNATGFAHQNHLVHAAELGEWWIWYVSSADTTHLLSRWSNDFVTWNQGNSVSLDHTHGNDGRNLAIADKVLNGKHVVHISTDTVDTVHAHAHIRATLDGNGVCTFGAAVRTNSGGGVIEPDGPAVVVTDSGLVIDGSGWDATPKTPPLMPCVDGDMEVFTFGSLDTGAAFDSNSSVRKVVWCTTQRTNARWFTSSGEIVYALYENAAKDPVPTNLFFNVRDPSGTWIPDETTTRIIPPTVFPVDIDMPLNDWSARIAGAQMHAVRRTGAANDIFEHKILALGDVAAAWGPGASIPSSASVAGSGVFLAAYGEGIILVQITDASGLALEYTFFDGTQWTAWTALDVPSTARKFLAGSTRAGDDHPALIWMEAGSGVQTITGALLP